MNKTKIEWVKNPDGTQGYTWNPITGCLNGCVYCYARKLANGRLRKIYLANKILGYDGGEEKRVLETDPFYPRFWPSKECEPIRRNIYKGKPHKERGIFTCNMSDLFGIGIPEEWTRHILATIQCCPIDRFYLLTKQPQNLIKFSPFPDNCWVGVTATDSPSFHKNIVPFLNMNNYIREVEAPIRFISFEPLLGSIKYDEWDAILSKDMVDWVIIGAQSRPTIMPKIEWVQEIVEAADKAGIPVFLKDSLGALLPRPISIRFGSLDEGLRQEMPKCQQETPQ